MKKLVLIVAAACFMTACNSNSSDSTSSDSSTAMSSGDTSSTMMSPAPAPADTTSSATNSAAMKDGVMTMKSGKMMVMNGGNWEAMTADVTCTNGVKVSTSGEMTKGTKKKTLTEGMMIDKDGQLMDANGKLADNAGW